MKPFEYRCPSTLTEACALLAEPEVRSKALAGGTDVLVELRRPGVRTPERIIDISRLAGLNSIAERDGVIVIGALTTHAQISESEIIRSAAPFLAEAAASIGAIQIRNRGTIGGNIMNAATCADLVPPLAALGAGVNLVSTAAERQVGILDLFTQPYRTSTDKGELLTSVSFPVPLAGSRSAFIKLGRRNALAISRLSVAVLMHRTREGVIDDLRIVPGAATPVWYRMAVAEEILLNRRPTDDLIDRAADAAATAMVNVTGHRWSTPYKQPVIATLTGRALRRCCESA